MDAGAGGTGAGGGGTGAGGGGVAAPWYAALPDDLKGNQNITSLKSVEDLAKGYVSAQSLIGQKRLAVPGKDATPQQWDEVYNAIGRPETFDKYSEPTVKAVDGVTMDKDGLVKARQLFHKAGLTDAQQKQVMDFYYNGINDNFTKLKQSSDSARDLATQALKQEWGDKFDPNLNIAKEALRKFGDPEAMKEIEAGLGNNPALIKMFHRIGSTIMEDRSRGGGQGDFNPGGAADALRAIDDKKGDANFMTALNTANHPQHKAAVATWTELHGKAFPKKSDDQ